MGREIKRVPLGFDWPIGKVWDGFLMPDKFDEKPCPDCRNGYSDHANALFDLWYGHVPFDPETTGSKPFPSTHPSVRRLAERNVSGSPEFYARYVGATGEEAVAREAQRLADLWNGAWSHHLSQDDVDALLDGNRLWDFTHTHSLEHGWRRKDPPHRPLAAEVNEWSLLGIGHDSVNASLVIEARCQREGMPRVCGTCEGHGSFEAYEGQRAEADAWTPTEPPSGDGWQLWETVSEGSPVSPAFATSEDLVAWISDPSRERDWLPPEQAAAFVKAGWAPSFIAASGHGLVGGMEAVGRGLLDSHHRTRRPVLVGELPRRSRMHAAYRQRTRHRNRRRNRHG